jgi:peptidoglycan-N-acetylglucosamine deacetylase
VRTPSEYAEAIRWRVEGLRWWHSSPPRRLKDLGPRGGRPARSVALTFDDGPDPVHTPQVLSTLADHDVRATFFLCGAAAEHHPELVRAITAEGHTIGGHTWHHVDVRGLSSAAWAREVDATHDLLAGLTGHPIRWFRPPWGDHDRAARRRLAERAIVPILFSSLGFDWLTDDADAIVGAVTDSLQPGAIVLLHDGCGDLLSPESRLPEGAPLDRTATVAALPRIIEAVEARGYGCVALPR